MPEARGDKPDEMFDAAVDDRAAPGTQRERREDGGVGQAGHPGSTKQPRGAGIRIQKAMAHAGVASRREAERMVAGGRVRVNGQDVLHPGHLLLPGDELEVDGNAVEWERKGVHELWALYKPKRCVCTLSDPQGRRTVRDFFPRTEQRLFPVGRLDYDAEGLLLLTNYGALAQRVTHPSYGMPRVYLVKVRGMVSAETVRALGRGIVLDGVRRQPARTRVLHSVNDKTWLEVVLREGIHHHLKKMFHAVGHPVVKIKRYRIGPIELGDLQPGRARKLGRADMDRLMRWAGRRDSGPGEAGEPRGRNPREPGGASGGEDVPFLRVPTAELVR